MVFVDQKSKFWENDALRKKRGLNLNLQKDVLDMTACFTQCWDLSCSSSDLQKSVGCSCSSQLRDLRILSRTCG